MEAQTTRLMRQQSLPSNKVVGVVVTSDRHAFVQEACLFRLLKQTVPLHHILVIDTSKTMDNAEYLKKKGFDVHYMKWKEGAISRIVQAKNSAIDWAEIYGCTHILFCDADTIIPKWSLDQLLSKEKDCIGWVSPIGKNSVTIPSVFRSPLQYTGVSFDCRDVYDWTELNARKGEVIQVFGCNFGLISMKVLKQVRFRDDLTQKEDGQRPLGEDLRFWMDCKEQGINWYCDTGLIVEHLSIEWEGVIWQKNQEEPILWK